MIKSHIFQPLNKSEVQREVIGEPETDQPTDWPTSRPK